MSKGNIPLSDKLSNYQNQIRLSKTLKFLIFRLSMAARNTSQGSGLVRYSHGKNLPQTSTTFHLITTNKEEHLLTTLERTSPGFTANLCLIEQGVFQRSRLPQRSHQGVKGKEEFDQSLWISCLYYLINIHHDIFTFVNIVYFLKQNLYSNTCISLFAFTVLRTNTKCLERDLS